MKNAQLWKLKPEAVVKPWGLVHSDALRLTGVQVGVGELWIGSAQTGPGNLSNMLGEPPRQETLAQLLREAQLMGDSALADFIGAGAVNYMRSNPHRGKTEAWCVRVADGHTGVAAGPGSPEDAEQLKKIIQSGSLTPDTTTWSDEVRRLFGLVEPLQGGEIFLVPAGALHTIYAVGQESRLVIDEIQEGYGDCLLPTLSKILMVQNDLLSVQVHPDDQTVADSVEGRLYLYQDLQSNPTVRVCDFGRRPGEYPELGFELVDPEAGLRRVPPLQAQVGHGHRAEATVLDPHFAKCRLALSAAGTYSLGVCCASYHVLHWLDGTAELRAPDQAMMVRRGETVFVPACLEDEVRIAPETDCEIFDDFFPDIPHIVGFFGSRGATPDQIEAALNPPRVAPK